MATKKQSAKLYPERIEFLDFNILQGRIETPEGFDLTRIVKHDFSVDLKLAFNLDEKLIKSTVLFDVSTDSEGGNDTEASSTFRLQFIFRYEDLDALAVPVEDKKINLHPYLGNAVASITYSTSRGILMTRYQGTPFRDFILPVINPDELLD